MSIRLTIAALCCIILIGKDVTQMKILRRPKLAAAIAVVADILILAAAVVLDRLRGSFSATYAFDPESLAISESHPYDMFGAAAAVVLVLAAVMSAFMIAGAFTSGGSRTAQRITGGVCIMVFSAAAVLCAFMLVNGRRPDSVEYLSYTDDELRIVVAEEHYGESLGVAEFFAVDSDTGEARLLVTTDISTFADGDKERYTLLWTDEGRLGIRFVDGLLTRMIRVDVSRG